MLERIHLVDTYGTEMIYHNELEETKLKRRLLNLRRVVSCG